MTDDTIRQEEIKAILIDKIAKALTPILGECVIRVSTEVGSPVFKLDGTFEVNDVLEDTVSGAMNVATQKDRDRALMAVHQLMNRLVSLSLDRSETDDDEDDEEETEGSSYGPIFNRDLDWRLEAIVLQKLCVLEHRLRSQVGPELYAYQAKAIEGALISAGWDVRPIHNTVARLLVDHASYLIGDHAALHESFEGIHDKLVTKYIYSALRRGILTRMKVFCDQTRALSLNPDPTQTPVISFIAGNNDRDECDSFGPKISIPLFLQDYETMLSSLAPQSDDPYVEVIETLEEGLLAENEIPDGFA